MVMVPVLRSLGLRGIRALIPKMRNIPSLGADLIDQPDGRTGYYGLLPPLEQQVLSKDIMTEDIETEIATMASMDRGSEMRLLSTKVGMEEFGHTVGPSLLISQYREDLAHTAIQGLGGPCQVDNIHSIDLHREGAPCRIHTQTSQAPVVSHGEAMVYETTLQL